ncbi:MAG: AMP-binding protein [Acidobacteria bacterium]|nr:AMP-binding protein [Acidobacteriota bacterium]
MQLRDDFAWQPTQEMMDRAQLTRFLEFCSCDSFVDLYQRSITDVAWFTEQLLQFLDLQFDSPYTQVVDLTNGIQFPRWCVGGKLNITKNCLDRWADQEATAHAPAVIWEGEEGTVLTLSYSELLNEVERCAAGLRACGLKKGDAVGLHLPMGVETVIAMLAINRIGGIAVPLFSGYGATAIASRLQDVGAKALFTCDAFPRRGKAVAAKIVADQAINECPGILRVFVVQRLRTTVPMKSGRDLYFDQLLNTGDKQIRQGFAEITDAEDPLIAIYTSGTTGKPKGILHTHCGFPVKAAQDMCLGTDVGQGDRISWVTDIGWMMGPWLIYGALILGATVVLYDGAPDFPAADRLWEFSARHKLTTLGISPTLIRALATQGDELPAKHDLPTLRILASTGEAWNPEPWWWLFEKVGKKQIPIINYSGGTEISGGILMSNPLLPIKPCGFAAPCPGIAADVVDENGNSVRNAVGELVIRAPWIGMARGFWQDNERYLNTYWSRFENIWVHGDWALVDDDNQWFILGRSDDTLKIAGKRVGPAEIESILVNHPAVVEAAAIGIPDERKGSAMVVFCVLRETTKTTDELAGELKHLIAAQMGKPLQPERVIFLPALPKTRNGKVMRRVIRAAYLNENAGDLTALDNPAAVEAIRNLTS